MTVGGEADSRRARRPRCAASAPDPARGPLSAGPGRTVTSSALCKPTFSSAQGAVEMAAWTVLSCCKPRPDAARSLITRVRRVNGEAAERRLLCPPAGQGTSATVLPTVGYNFTFLYLFLH